MLIFKLLPKHVHFSNMYYRSLLNIKTYIIGYNSKVKTYNFECLLNACYSQFVFVNECLLNALMNKTVYFNYKLTNLYICIIEIK